MSYITTGRIKSQTIRDAFDLFYRVKFDWFCTTSYNQDVILRIKQFGYLESKERSTTNTARFVKYPDEVLNKTIYESSTHYDPDNILMSESEYLIYRNLKEPEMVGNYKFNQ